MMEDVIWASSGCHHCWDWKLRCMVLMPAHVSASRQRARPLLVSVLDTAGPMVEGARMTRVHRVPRR